jgi:hypothetical protein
MSLLCSPFAGHFGRGGAQVSQKVNCLRTENFMEEIKKKLKKGQKKEIITVEDLQSTGKIRLISAKKSQGKKTR